MSKENQQASNTTDRGIVLTRMLNAPRELVFKVWTDPAHLSQWWGPDNFTAPVCEVELKVGGAIRIDMAGPDGWLMQMGGYFKEIVPNEKLVFITTGFNDEQGNPTLENLNIVTFEEENGKTKLTVRTEVLKASGELAQAIEGMSVGWNESLDRMEDVIEKQLS